MKTKGDRHTLSKIQLRVIGNTGIGVQILISIKQALLSPYKEALEQDERTLITEAKDHEELTAYASSYEYDSIVIDCAAFPKTLQAIIREIRQHKARSAIITFSGSEKLSSGDIVCLLDSGADEVICTPMCPEEFMARHRAIIRRAYGHSHSNVTVGNITVDLQNHQVTINGKQVDLTNKEQALLECLALNKDRILSKESLLSYIYGGMDEPEIRIIDAFVWRIRKKLNDAGQEDDYMQTVWGRGYRLSDKDLPSS